MNQLTTSGVIVGTALTEIAQMDLVVGGTLLNLDLANTGGADLNHFTVQLRAAGGSWYDFLVDAAAAGGPVDWVSAQAPATTPATNGRAQLHCRAGGATRARFLASVAAGSTTVALNASAKDQ